jgi:hypothetical protein
MKGLLKAHASFSRWARERLWNNPSAKKQVVVLCRLLDLLHDQYGPNCIAQMDAAEVCCRRVMALECYDRDGSWGFAKNLEEQDDGSYIPQTLLDDALRRHKALDKEVLAAKDGLKAKRKAEQAKRHKKGDTDNKKEVGLPKKNQGNRGNHTGQAAWEKRGRPSLGSQSSGSTGRSLSQ